MKGGAVIKYSPFTVIMSENIISFSSADFKDVGCDKKQTMRFLGCKGGEINPELEALYEECLELVCKEAFFKAVWRKTKVEFVGEDTVQFDFGKIKSASLSKNLEGCKSAYVFAATAGMGIDRLLLRCRHTDTVKAAVLSCVGSSCIECWCDKINFELIGEKKLRPRFSPGYGGVELRHQKEILEYLDAYKKLGISLTDTFFMTPVKSVTAFIGIEEE